jgi:hypothetical protein
MKVVGSEIFGGLRRARRIIGNERLIGKLRGQLCNLAKYSRHLFMKQRHRFGPPFDPRYLCRLKICSDGSGGGRGSQLRHARRIIVNQRLTGKLFGQLCSTANRSRHLLHAEIMRFGPASVRHSFLPFFFFFFFNRAKKTSGPPNFQWSQSKPRTHGRMRGARLKIPTENFKGLS